MIRIVIIDDHAMVREGLCARIHQASALAVVGEAGTAAEGIAAVKAHQPDVVVLDLKLPDAHGLSVIPALHKASRNAKIVILTMFDDIHYAAQAFEAGAHGFVIKGAQTTELLEAVREAARGRSYISAALAPHLAEWIRDRGAPSTGELSGREREVLKLLAEGYNLTQIGEFLRVSPKTVATYRDRLLEKLKLPDQGELVRYARSRTGAL